LASAKFIISLLFFVFVAYSLEFLVIEGRMDILEEKEKLTPGGLSTKEAKELGDLTERTGFLKGFLFKEKPEYTPPKEPTEKALTKEEQFEEEGKLMEELAYKMSTEGLEGRIHKWLEETFNLPPQWTPEEAAEIEERIAEREKEVTEQKYGVVQRIGALFAFLTFDIPELPSLIRTFVSLSIAVPVAFVIWTDVIDKLPTVAKYIAIGVVGASGLASYLASLTI